MVASSPILENPLLNFHHFRDAAGFALWYKRLEKARFMWPRKHETEVISIDSQQLGWLLSGYDVWRMKPHEKVNYARVS